jgi:Flp pilus assembly protein protease CpaA
MNFFFWFFVLGFFIALLQDLKRREVDNWLNLFLFFSGFLFVLSNVFRFDEITFLTNFAILTFFMLFLAYVFYYSRIFAGGDCKLLFATTPLLVSFSLTNSFLNVLFFCVAMLFIGAIYGIFWIVGLFLKDFEKNGKDFLVLVKKSYFVLIILAVFLILGLVEKVFFVLAIFVLFLYLVYIFSKTIEKNSLTREISPRELREGDWIKENIRFKNRKIKSSFEGLSLDDISFLRNYKRKIKIKDGIPYAPVFLFSWIAFYSRGIVLEIVSRLFWI